MSIAELQGMTEAIQGLMEAAPLLSVLSFAWLYCFVQVRRPEQCCACTP